MASRGDEALQERLKASLWFSIGKIIDEETLRLNTSATPQFIGAMTEMLWSQIENVSQDLESFSRHAGRTTVTTDDVLLVTRRNDALQALTREFIEKGKERDVRAKASKRAAPAKGMGSGKEKGIEKAKPKPKSKPKPKK